MYAVQIYNIINPSFFHSSTFGIVVTHLFLDSKRSAKGDAKGEAKGDGKGEAEKLRRGCKEDREGGCQEGVMMNLRRGVDGRSEGGWEMIDRPPSQPPSHLPSQHLHPLSHPIRIFWECELSLLSKSLQRCTIIKSRT